MPIAKSLGYQGLTKDLGYDELLKDVPERLWSLLTPSTVPRLTIDIKFKHYQKLSKMRRFALQKGAILFEEKEFVPARLRFNGKTIKAKLRLKGDLLDHVNHEDKWSFRIHIKGDDHFLGMRKFSIQQPSTRDYQGEGLFLETLRFLDVLAPRFSYVNVTINGQDIGLMALEEHFSKELLESQGRREGVVVKYDETLLWQANPPERGKSPYFSQRNAPITAFSQGKIDKTEKLREDYAVAVGLMRSFAYETLPPSEVFDVETMGKFVAAADFWGSYHAA